MSGRDDGEFELILGNKQLLSVLFIVIVLLGVFFAMGFLAGRTTGAAPAVAQNNSQDRQPLAVDSASGRSPLVTEEKTVSAQRVVEPPAATPPAPRAEPIPETKAEPPAAVKPAPAKSASADASGYIAVPPAGSYLQAAATRRADSEAMLMGIRTKTGLTGYVTPSPKSAELFRVIVGPLATKAQQAEARTKLADIGIKNPYLVTY